MKVTYAARNFSKDAVTEKYIGFNVFGELKLYEVGVTGHTLRESTVSPNDYLVDDIRRAKEFQGLAFNKVLVWTKP